MTKRQGIRELIEKKCVEKNIPFHIVFEITYNCNLSCRHCYIAKDKQRELNLEEIKDILDQLVKIGSFHLILTGGEIFTRNDFFEIATYAKKRGFSLELLTNGTLITEQIVDRLKELKPLGVEISLLGANSYTHDYITKTSGSFQKTVQSIKWLVDRNITVISKTVLMKLNVKECKAIKTLAQNLGAIPNIGLGIIPKKDGSNQSSYFELSFKERKKYLSKDDFELNFLIEDSIPKNMLTCKAGKAMAAITPNGDVQPCILMPLKLGNLRENSFTEIWYSNTTKELNQIRKITPSDLITCSRCKNLSFCIRCPGVAFMETDTLVEPSPTACENTKWREYQYKKRMKPFSK